MDSIEKRRPRRLRRELIHESIRSQIVEGKLASGTALSEIDLAASLKASRTPVREALMQLQEEGLVEIVPRRGPVVRHVAPHEMFELLMVREALESLAVQLAVDRMSSATLQELRAEWEDLQRNLSDASRDLVFAKCEDFHLCVIEGAQSAILTKLVGSIRDRIASARQLYLKPHGHPALGRLRLSCIEHLDIIKALQARESQRCEQLIREHLRGIAREIMDGAGARLKVTY